MICCYIIGFGLSPIRPFTGPFSKGVCSFATLAQAFTAMAMSLTVLNNAVMRFTFIFVFKTFPIMMDNFLSFFIKLNILFLMFLSVIGKYYIEEKIPVSEKICNGTPIFQDEFSRSVPLGAFVCVISMFGYIFVSLCIKIQKKNRNESQFENHTNFGSLFNSTIAISSIFFTVLCFIFLNKIEDAQDLERFPGWFYMNGYLILGPFLAVISNCIVLYAPNPRLRRAVKRIFVQERIHPLTE